VGGHDARLVNLPTRAVTGPRWRGRTDVVEAPQDYDAIHFHIDDLDDAGWSEDIAFSLPDDLDSGVYAVELTDADGAQDTVPVFVLPPAGRATSDVALLMPTMSYLAYANERMQEHPKLQSPGWLSRPIIPDEGDLHLQRHPEYGSSIYDTHLDGSGVCLSSARRPVMNLRPGHRNWQTHAPRALAADLLTVEFLDQEGIAVDIITDHEVHEHGTDLLKRYRVVLTGSHPEYVSDELLDALEAWLDAGGRLVYLGGNGWYWVTSIHPEHPWVVEVRRGIGGIRTWESAPGELRHQSTLEPGGLWRYRGRDPNRLVGSGFSGQGFDPVAPGYALREEGSDPRAAWIFEGIDADVVGDSGLILGGAAGDEIDRYDKRWGTPPHALRIATSQGLHTEFVLLVSEDLPVTHPNVGADVHPAVRADLVFFETHGGGAVFSVGSMAFPGALVADEGRTSAAQMLRNVLARFRDPALFPAPPAAEPLPYISQASAVGPIPGEEEPRPAEPEAARTMA
jgi:N,N-dimethylformamidase